MDLKWTKLRHMMLRAIRDGQVSRGLAPSGWWIRADVVGAYGYAERAVSALVHADLARLPNTFDYATPIILTGLGELILAEWESRHAEKVAS